MNRELFEIAFGYGPVPRLHHFGSVLRRRLDTSFGLPQFHGHGSWLICEVALKSSVRMLLRKPTSTLNWE